MLSTLLALHALALPTMAPDDAKTARQLSTSGVDVTSFSFMADGHCCAKHEIEASKAWALWKAEDGTTKAQADYTSSLYATWLERARQLCAAKSNCRAVSVWKDAGYRLYTDCDAKTLQNTNGIVRSFAWKTASASSYSPVADGRCTASSNNEVDSTNMWALLFPGEARTVASFDSETYATWVARAQERCMAKADCRAVSVWNDAGYRLYKSCDAGSMEEVGRVRSFQWSGSTCQEVTVSYAPDLQSVDGAYLRSEESHNGKPVYMHSGGAGLRAGSNGKWTLELGTASEASTIASTAQMAETPWGTVWLPLFRPSVTCTRFAAKPDPPALPKPNKKCDGSDLNSKPKKSNCAKTVEWWMANGCTSPSLISWKNIGGEQCPMFCHDK